jgi:aryl sulfotransferase
MATVIPERSASYLGPITDTNRWQNFKHRADDIFVCTPPKCGTTWTQAICAMLVAGKVDHGTQPGIVSPWIDANFAPIEDYLQQVEAQSVRRYIKTHSPLDGIPYFPECTYLVVLRDPRDVFCSMLNHRDNMNDQNLALALFPSGDSAFEDWLNRELEPGTWDAQSLALLVHFFLTYWKFRDLPNIHVFHYSDMKRDLKGSIAAMAAALNVDLDEPALDAMTAAASFANMKSNAEQFAPESGTGMWKQESGFFANGRNAQWKDLLTESDLAAFDGRLNEQLPPDQAQWLLNGNG